MHPYLTRLGVRAEVQEFFASFYQADTNGNLVFDYGGETEAYGFAFHRVPVSGGLWVAGQENSRLAGQVFICSSAMEALSFLAFRYTAYPDTSGLLFISIGPGLNDSHLQPVCSSLPEKKCTLLFGNDFVGKVTDLKIAAGIRKVPVAVYEQDGICTVNFRNRNYSFHTDAFSLNAFEKQAGYRFNIRTLKPKGFNTFFDQLKARAF